MENDPQIRDVLVAVERFESNINSRFDGIHDRFGLFDERFRKVEHEMSSLAAVCVTRSYLDQQMLDVRSDVSTLVTLVRKGDMKVSSLVEVLHARKVISDGDRSQLLSMGPYPKA